MLTLDLQKLNGHEVIQGKLIVNISTNINAPIRNGVNTLLPSAPATISRNPSNSAMNQQAPNLPPPPRINNPSAAPVGTENPDENRNNDLPEG